MPFLELFDETLDINSTENYNLSLQVSPDSFSYCLLDTIRNKFVLLRSFEPDENKYFNIEKITELLSKDDFLLRIYKKVNIVTPSARFTIVPAPLFDPGKKDDYFRLNHTPEDDDIILVNKLVYPEAYLVYSISKRINDLIQNFYPGAHPYHHIRPIFDHSSHSRKSAGGNYIHIHVERDFFNMIVFNNNLLKFCNSFNYRNISDILYFVLNVFKSLGITQEETLHLSGITEQYDDLFSNISLYIRNIRFAVPSGKFTFSYVFDDKELHRFLNLFNVVNCG